VTDTSVSQSLGAPFSELTGQPTPVEFRVPVSITAAPIIGLPLAASLEQPPIVTTTLEATATVTAT